MGYLVMDDEALVAILHRIENKVEGVQTDVNDLKIHIAHEYAPRSQVAKAWWAALTATLTFMGLIMAIVLSA